MGPVTHTNEYFHTYEREPYRGTYTCIDLSGQIALTHVCDTIHEHVWLDLSCDNTYSCVWQNAFMCVTWLIHMCVTWLICTCDMPCDHSESRCIHMYIPVEAKVTVGIRTNALLCKYIDARAARVPVWHDSCICFARLVHMCEITHKFL